MTPSRPRVRALSTWPLVLVVLSASCGDNPSPTAVDRETFIETYVELRLAALQSPNRTISPERRQQILAARGITEDDLLAFAEAYGRDVDAMVAVWTEVEQRIAQRGAPADSVP